MREAPCITAGQSTMQEAQSTNHHREAGNAIIPVSLLKIKEEK